MRRKLSIVLSAAILGYAGCRPAAEPARQSAAPATRPATDRPPAGAPAERVEPDWPTYSEEQTAAARQLAEDLGVVLRQDAAGNVVSLDTAANRSWVDNYQMEELLAFPRLNSLTVEGPSLDDALAPRIAEQAGLELLALRNTLISDAGIGQFVSLKFLRVIDLRLCPMVTDGAMETLASMPQLRAVRISGTNVSDAGIEALLPLPQLVELDVRNCRKVTLRALQRLAGKKGLRTLKIGGQTIDDDVLDVVGRLDGLTGLSLDNCDISDAGVAKLRNLRLEDLTIYQCASVTDEGMAILAGLENLRQLTLREVGVRGTILAGLPNPGRLVSLNMAQSKITDEEVPHLVKLTGLGTLVLSETALSDHAIDGLSHIPSLQRLILTQTGLTAEGIERLRKALPDCSIESD